jgi:hypothetical protein
MAVASSINQIYIPGIDNLISENVDAAISASDTIEAINNNLQISGSLEDLENSVEGLSSDIDFLPSADPLPQFATFSNRDNSPLWNIYDSYINPIDAGSQHTDSELHAPWTGINYTNGNFGSNSWTSYWMGATPMQSADGHQSYNIQPGYAVYSAKNPDSNQYWMSRWGVIIGKRGKRQRFSLHLNDADLRVNARGISEGSFEQLSLNSTTYATWFGGTSYGSVGYNDRTQTLVAIEAKDASNNYRMHIWQNTGTNRSLNVDNYQTGLLHTFLSEAKAGLPSETTGEFSVISYQFKDFQWQQNASQNYNESRYRMRVVVGDNGIVGMARMVPSNVTNYATYTIASSTLNTSFNTIGLTTSYGVDNGNRYGMRHSITWDNNWVAAYSQYYYYGAGINVFFIDTRDPRNYFTGQNADTNNGCQLVPFGEDKFMFNRSIENADGNIGMRLFIINPEGARLGRITSTTISNGGVIPLTANIQYGMFDTKYTSTNYPVLMPVAHWRKVN